MGLFAAKAAAARAVGALSRRTGRGGGTTAPGKLLVRLAPDAIEQLVRRLPEGAVLVSATNGKTTTAAMAAAILAPDHVLCRNGSGANLVSGVATALLQARDAELGVFEVDEAVLPDLAERCRPRAILLGNLFRDQLDRFGELELLAERWRGMVARLDPETTLVVNADDPLVAAIAADRPGTVRFGLDDHSTAMPALQHAADSTRCTRCSTPLLYDAVYLGHLGDYRCPACGLARPPLDMAARTVEHQGLSGTRFAVVDDGASASVELGLPGLYNVYNAVAALALARTLGVPVATGAARLAGFRAAFGRFERIAIGGRDAICVLVKNPTGANEALRTLAPDLDGATVVLALNDRIADGRDVSWIWDVDLEVALPRAGLVICAGTRAADMALRVRYAGVPDGRITLVPDLAAALDRAVESTPVGRTAFVLPTYTAMLELQGVIAERNLARPYWETAAG